MSDLQHIAGLLAEVSQRDGEATSPHHPPPSYDPFKGLVTTTPDLATGGTTAANTEPATRTSRLPPLAEPVQQQGKAATASPFKQSASASQISSGGGGVFGQAPQKQVAPVATGGNLLSPTPTGLDLVPKELQAITFHTPTKESTVYSKILAAVGASGGSVPTTSAMANPTGPHSSAEPKHSIRDLPRFHQLMGINPSGDGNSSSARFGHVEQDHIRDKAFSLGTTFNQQPGLNLKNAESFYEWLAVVVLPSLKAIFENDLELLRMRNKRAKEKGERYCGEKTYTEKFFAQVPLKQKDGEPATTPAPTVHPLKGDPISAGTQERVVAALVTQMFPSGWEEGTAPFPLSDDGTFIDLAMENTVDDEALVEQFQTKESFLSVDLQKYTQTLSQLEYNFYRGKSDRGSGALKNTELAKRLCELGNSSNLYRKGTHYRPSACTTSSSSSVQASNLSSKTEKWPDHLSPISILPWFCPPSSPVVPEQSTSSNGESAAPPEVKPLDFEEYLACLSVFPKNAPRLWNTLATVMCLFLGSMKIGNSTENGTTDSKSNIGVKILSLEETCCSLVNASLDCDDPSEQQQRASALPIAPGAAIFLLHFALEASTHANVEHGATPPPSSGASSSTAGSSSCGLSTSTSSSSSTKLGSGQSTVGSGSSSSSSHQLINKMQESLGPTTKKKAMAAMVMRIMILLEETSKEIADLKMEADEMWTSSTPVRYRSSWLSWVRHYVIASQARVRDAMGQFDKAASFHWTNFAHLRGLDTQGSLKHFEQLGQKLLQQFDADKTEKKKEEKGMSPPTSSLEGGNRGEDEEDISKKIPQSKQHLLVSAKRESKEIVSSYPSLRKDVFSSAEDEGMTPGDGSHALILQPSRHHLSLPEQHPGNLALLTTSSSSSQGSWTAQRLLGQRLSLSALAIKTHTSSSSDQSIQQLLAASFLPLTPLMIESAFRLHQYFKVPAEVDAVRSGGSYTHYLLHDANKTSTTSSGGASSAPPPPPFLPLLGDGGGHPTAEELELVKTAVGDWLDTHGDMSKSFSHVTLDTPTRFDQQHLGYNESYLVGIEIAYRYFKEVHLNHASERSAMNTIIQEYCDAPNNYNITRGPVKDFLRAERDRMTKLHYFIYQK